MKRIVVGCAVMAGVLAGGVLTGSTQPGRSGSVPVRPVPKDARIVEKVIRHDGRDRHYLVVTPAGLRAGAPAVVLLHGGSQSMRRVLISPMATSRWVDLAVEHGLVLLVPNGWDIATDDGGGDRQTWNDLRGPVGNPISEEDDAGFIAAMVARERARLAFDADAVFVTGSSNGGMMAYRMLIEYPDVFRAGAAFIGNLPDIEVPAPAVARPVMIMNGDADPLMPWEGGGVGFGGAPVRSAGATVAYWKDAHGLADDAGRVTVLEDADPGDGCRVVEAAFGDAGGVTLYRVVNGGHTIPILAADPQPNLPPVIGTLCRDVRGVDLAWGFFERAMGR